MENFLNNPWVIGIGVTVIGGLILNCFFAVGKSKQNESRGGRGGNAKAIGRNSIALGGKGGGGGPGGKGGDGGDAEGIGDNILTMGGEGGEAGQADRGGRGGRAPLKVLQEIDPIKAEEIMKSFGITQEESERYGKGGDGSFLGK